MAKNKVELFDTVLESLKEIPNISLQEQIEALSEVAHMLLDDKFNLKTGCKKVQNVVMKLANDKISAHKIKPTDQHFMAKIHTLCN